MVPTLYFVEALCYGPLVTLMICLFVQQHSMGKLRSEHNRERKKLTERSRQQYAPATWPETLQRIEDLQERSRDPLRGSSFRDQFEYGRLRGTVQMMEESLDRLTRRVKQLEEERESGAA